MLTFIQWDFSGDIFTIPYLEHPVRWYGLMWALSFLLGQQIMYYIYKREGRPARGVESLTIYVIIAAFVGARLGHVLFYDPVYYFHNPWSILAIWEGGLASHGGAIGIFIALYIYSRKAGIHYLWILDRVAIIGALAAGLIRVGNLMNSEMIGVPTTMPWGFVFTNVDNIPRHPAQLYEAIYCFFLFLLLFWIWYKFREQLKNGFLFSCFLIILFGARFIAEFFKINQVPFEDNLILNMGQILSIPFVLTGIIILLFNKFSATTVQRKI
jgi:phosphatidylglycerol:prolipoprotein diacylglycerol transferase